MTKNLNYPHYRVGFSDSPLEPPTSLFLVSDEGEVPVFVGAMTTAELTRQVCDALNGNDDPLMVLTEAADVLEGLHEQLHRLRHEGVHEETVRQAGRVINNHASGNIAGPVVQTGYIGRVSTRDQRVVQDVTGLDRGRQDRIDLLGT